MILHTRAPRQERVSTPPTCIDPGTAPGISTWPAFLLQASAGRRHHYDRSFPAGGHVDGLVCAAAASRFPRRPHPRGLRLIDVQRRHVHLPIHQRHHHASRPRKHIFVVYSNYYCADHSGGLCHGISSLGHGWHRGDGFLRRTSVSARLGAWRSRRAAASGGGCGRSQHYWLRRAPWRTAADRFRRRTHQPDLHCCRGRRYCCGGAGQRSRGAQK